MSHKPRALLPILAAMTAIACGSSPAPRPTATAKDDVAERYVKVVLALGLHEPGYVDAYYGPPEWRAAVEQERPGLPKIRADAEALRARVQALPPAADELGALRQRYFDKQLVALLTRVDMLEGKRLRFDDESRALYDAVAPVVPEAQFEEVLARIERLLPGKGPILTRLDAMRDALVIPRDKIETVVTAAIAECRARTVKHIPLPAEERFSVEIVNNKPWGAYNWYQGNYRSVIQVNVDLPMYIDRAVTLACHEGYPGHHVQGILIERDLVRARGFTEMQVLPLYSPIALVAEGSANHGVKLAFPGKERAEFEQRVLAPLAGVDPARIAAYAEVAELLDRLKHVNNQAARRYLDGAIDAEAAAAYLVRYGLSTPDRARKQVTFIDANRSYVINYNLGEDLVRAWIDKQGNAEQQWAAFARLVGSPMTAGDLAR